MATSINTLICSLDHYIQNGTDADIKNSLYGLFSQLDFNNSGFLQGYELTCLLDPLSLYIKQYKLQNIEIELIKKWLMQHIDINNDGQISRTELIKELKKIFIQLHKSKNITNLSQLNLTCHKV